MTPEAAASLRHAAAHLVVDDVAAPELDDAVHHHLFRVLRLRDGETVTLTDGRGRWRVGRAARGGVVPDGEVHAERVRERPVTIAFAVPKADRPEWVVQKLTELGVDRIVVLESERSVVRWSGERADRHLARLRRVAVEALQQSRAVWLPSIEGPLAAATFLADAVAAEPGGRPLTVDDRTVAIGPEGGWTATELALAAGTVSLGTSVLRVETAALVSAARLIMEATRRGN